MEGRLPLLLWVFLVLTVLPLTWVLFRGQNEHRKLSWFRKYKIFQWFCGTSFFISILGVLTKVDVISDDDQFSMLFFFLVIPFSIVCLLAVSLYLDRTFRRMIKVVADRNIAPKMRARYKAARTTAIKILEPIIYIITPSIAIALLTFGTARVLIFSAAPHTLEEQCSSIANSAQGKNWISIVVQQRLFEQTHFRVGSWHVPAGLLVGRQFCVTSKKGYLGYRQIWTYDFP